MNHLRYVWYSSHLWHWILRLRGRVAYGYRLGYSISLKEARELAPPGWSGLIDGCFGLCLMTGAGISQIKDKYGGLRFYAWNTSPSLLDMIDAAEAYSLTMCEECGRQAKQWGSGWIRTLCDDHAKIEGLFEGMDGIISDEYGNTWSAYCAMCDEETMSIVRPGEVQCANCG